MRSVRVGCMLIACLAALGPTQAQETVVYPQDTGVTGPIVWNIGGVLSVPVGSTSDRTNVGGGVAAGVTFNLNHYLGFQLEYAANWFSLKTNSQAANLGIFGNGFWQYFNLNGVLRPIQGQRFGVYLIGGGGLYYRSASISRVTGTALAPYCDPYLFYCSAVPVTASSVIGSRSSWDWGVDGGVGFTFGLSPPLRLYLEARYHYIWGPSFTAPGGQSRSANGQFVPIALGVQF